MRRIGRGLHSWRPARLWTAVIICGLLAALLPATAVAAPKVTVQLCIGCYSLSGQGPANTNIAVLWKSSAGDVRQKVTVKSNAGGHWSTPDLIYDFEVTPGDTVKATIGTWTRTFTVPRLSLRLDRPSGVASGRGPANTSLDLYLGTTGDCYDAAVTTDALGAFSHDFGADGAVVDGRSGASVRWRNASGDSVSMDVSAPRIGFYRGMSGVWGWASPGMHIDVELLDTSMAPNGEARLTPDRDGYAWTDFLDADGMTVSPATGDHVQARLTGAPDPFADIVVPAVSITGVARTDVVTGTCVVAADFWAEASAPNWSRDFWWSSHLGAGKSFSRDITAKMDLRSGDRLYLSCTLPTAGDWVDRIALVP